MKYLEIPIKPLAISKAWKGRKSKTPEYSRWQRDFSLLIGRHEPIKGNLKMTVEFHLKNNKMSDIDNLFKTLQDTLTLCNVIEDDRYIHEIHAYKYKSDNEYITIKLENI